VKLAGVRVGRVTRLKLLPARRDAEGGPLPVQMEVEIDEKIFAQLKADASFVVATQGPLGEPFLEITPGSERAALLHSGDELRGTDPARMDLLSSKLFAFLDGATHLVGEDAAQASRDISEAARDLKKLAASASAALDEKGSARRMLDDLSAMAAQLRRDLPPITEKAQRAADGAASVAGAFTADDSRQIKEALGRYREAAETLNEVAARADRVLARLEAGEGTLGGLAKDPAVYQDLKSLVTDLKRHPWKVLWKE
jgi:phospholipid/cholesterol/gamma-HCH transport system substrate-binding protein